MQNFSVRRRLHTPSFTFILIHSYTHTPIHAYVLTAVGISGDLNKFSYTLDQTGAARTVALPTTWGKVPVNYWIIKKMTPAEHAMSVLYEWLFRFFVNRVINDLDSFIYCACDRGSERNDQGCKASLPRWTAGDATTGQLALIPNAKHSSCRHFRF